MITLMKYIGGTWERCRENLREDLEHIQEAVNTLETSLLGNNPTNQSLQPSTILGNPNPVPKYVASTGPNQAPNWDQIDLASSGVKNRIAYGHFEQASGPSLLLGTQSGSPGSADWQEIALGAGLLMTGTILSATGSGGTVTHTVGALTAKELVVGNGGADIKTVAATDGQVPIGKSSDGSVNLGTLTPGNGISITNGPGTITIAAIIAQFVSTQTGAVATGTTTITLNDTIPTNTAGDQYLSLAITPKSSTNRLRIDVTVQLSHSVAGTVLSALLFQDTTANALAAAFQTCDNANDLVQVTFSFEMVAGTTSSTTFKIRCGGSAAGTTTFNGQSGSRLYGGVLNSSIMITELTP